MFRSLPFPGFTLQDMCTCGHQQNMTVGVSCWCPQVSIFYSWRSSFWWNSAYNQTVDDCCVEGWWVCKSHVVDTGESIIMHLDGFQHHLRRNFACRLGAVASARFCQDPLHWYECGIGALVWTGVQILAVCNCWAIRNLRDTVARCWNLDLKFGYQHGFGMNLVVDFDVSSRWQGSYFWRLGLIMGAGFPPGNLCYSQVL